MAEPIDAPAYLVVISITGMTLLLAATFVGLMKIARYFNPPKARPSRHIDLESHEYRNKGPARWGEPIFGPNAKPFIKQFAVGLGIFLVIMWFRATNWYADHIEGPGRDGISWLFSVLGLG